MVECFVEMGQIGQDYGLKQRLMDKSELDHVTQVIGYHPSYLEHFLKIQNFILRGDGPLPYAYRHYLAIMAAARHQCIYLINLHTQEFIDQGGDPNWLKGLDHIPPKLRAIYDINKILAHRPWLLNTEHIERLTKGQHNWSLSEVVHAIVLLSHFHSLSSFVFSCGRTQELDGKAPASSTASPVKIIQHKPGCNCKNRDQPVLVSTASADNQLATPAPAGGSPSAPGAASAAAGIKQEVSVAALMARMITLAEKRYECSETELSNRFKHVEQQAAELPAIVEHSTSTSTTTSSNSPTSATNPTSAASATVEPVPVPLMISHLVDDAAFTYQDFQRRGNTENIPSTFRIQDYSWDDHGYSLVNRLYNDVGNLLDDKFRAAYNLTYHTMADRTNVDTSKFRRAIWNYIQCMFGIRHDDYDYGEVNQLLERSLKMFIKTACCFPERITKKDYDSILCELQHSEKVHINLMILEARNQAELLYALREIMRYMT